MKTNLSVRKDLFISDLHAPHHNKSAVGAVLEYARWYKPDGVHVLGDVGNFTSVSHWLHKKGKKLPLEGKRIAKDMTSACDMLNDINMATPKATNRIVTIGNHEYWVEQYIEDHPELEGLMEIDIEHRYGGLGYKCIKFNEPYRNGKLLEFHGFYTNKYHAAKTVSVFGRSCIYNHTHDHQVFEDTFWKDRHMAMSIGCLCDMNPDYLRNHPTKWVHGFATVEFFSSGNFTVDFINIINGNFSRNGKVYGG